MSYEQLPSSLRFPATLRFDSRSVNQSNDRKPCIISQEEEQARSGPQQWPAGFDPTLPHPAVPDFVQVSMLPHLTTQVKTRTRRVCFCMQHLQGLRRLCFHAQCRSEPVASASPALTPAMTAECSHRAAGV